MTEGKRLYFVHAVDTEGPLYQSPKATALRLNELYGLGIDVNLDFAELRSLIQEYRKGAGSGDPEAERIAHFLSTTDFLSDRESYRKAIDRVTGESFRSRYADPQGGPYRFSWFVLDNVATQINPRRRLVGYGQVYLALREAMSYRASLDIDGFYLHYHQMREGQHPFVKETNFFSSDEYNQILMRNIVEHRHFPAAYRAGYCLERWDANLWLENWIPFDFSNHAMSFDVDVRRRVADETDFWLRAPSDWSYYHPDSRDYERPGNLRRTIFRSLCYRTRLYTLGEEDVRAAFSRADSGRPTVFSSFSHEFRDLEPEIDGLYRLVEKVAAEFPEVEWRHATAVEAARGVLGYPSDDEKLVLRARVEGDLLLVKSNRQLFGSEPFLALMTKDHRYIHQNFVRTDKLEWAYHLRYPEIIKFIGVGANDEAGNSATDVLENRDGEFARLDGSGYWAGSPE